MASSQELNRIAKRLFKNRHTHLNPGATVRCNHGEECPAGNETRGRLYITRCHHPANLYTWYCHNCGEGGAFKMTGVRKDASAVSLTPAPDNSEYIRMVLDRSITITTELDAHSFLPSVALDWLNLDRRSYPAGWVGWDPVEHAVVFTIWESSQEFNECDGLFLPQAIQHRYFRTHGPKCITTRAHEDFKVGTLMADFGSLGSPLVIVEDPQSMHAVFGAESSVNAYCLYGSHMDVTQLYSLYKKGIRDVIVWLDNDNDTVLKNADLIARRAHNLGMQSHVICTVSEPKKHTNEQIRNIIGGTFE